MDPRLRFDRSGLLGAPRVQADDTVIFDAVLSRAGVLKYRNDDGSWRSEYRPPNEVFDPESMQSFDGMAATFQHPNGYPVTAENRSDLQVGYIVPGSLRRDGHKLIGSIHVTDANMIRVIRSGRTSVSLGYFQDRVVEDGTSPEDGQPYKYKQTHIRGNHVALAVDVARAGDDARVVTDSLTSQEIVMEELKKALADLLAAQTEANKLKMRVDALETDNGKLTKQVSTLEAERDTAIDKAAKADKLRVDGEANTMGKARARVELEATAKRHLTVDGECPAFVVDGAPVSDRKLRELVIVKLTGKEIPTGKSDAYIDARFDHLTEDAADHDTNDQRSASQLAKIIKPDLTIDSSDPDVRIRSALRTDGTYDMSKLTAADCQRINAKSDQVRWQQPQQQKK